MALDLIKEITQIGEFLRTQREVLPAETWSQMNTNHVSAIRARIGSLSSLTSLDATQMVEAIRTAHFRSEDKAVFCTAVSARADGARDLTQKTPQGESNLCGVLQLPVTAGQGCAEGSNIVPNNQTDPALQPVLPHRPDVAIGAVCGTDPEQRSGRRPPERRLRG